MEKGFFVVDQDGGFTSSGPSRESCVVICMFLFTTFHGAFLCISFSPIKMCECLGMIASKSESVTQDGFLKVVISKIFFL